MDVLNTPASERSQPSDEDLARIANRGDKVACENLIRRYRPMIEKKAKNYFIAGAEREDIVQEGLIGLYKAIRDFDPDRRTRFKPFANLCVTRQIVSALKSANRQKHLPMNSHVVIEESDGGLSSLAGGASPNQIAIAIATSLSPLERSVLRCYLNGMSYSEMSRELKCPSKSIDNALQRVKKKLSLVFKH